MGRRYKIVKTQAPKRKKPPKPNRYLQIAKKVPKSLEECTKKQLLERIQEVMTRAWGKLPDAVISDNWDWDKYKAWITTPFLYMNYEDYDDSREI